MAAAELLRTCIAAERMTADIQLLVFLFNSIMAMLDGGEICQALGQKPKRELRFAYPGTQ